MDELKSIARQLETANKLIADLFNESAIDFKSIIGTSGKEKLRLLENTTYKLQWTLSNIETELKKFDLI